MIAWPTSCSRNRKHIYFSSFKVMSRFIVDEVIKYRGPFPYIDGLILPHVAYPQRREALQASFPRPDVRHWCVWRESLPNETCSAPPTRAADEPRMQRLH